MHDPAGRGRWRGWMACLVLGLSAAQHQACRAVEPLRLVLELGAKEHDGDIASAVERLRDSRLAGVLVRLDRESDVPAGALRSATVIARECGVPLWVGVALGGSRLESAAATAASGAAVGVALIVPRPAGVPLPAADRKGLMALKAAGAGRAEAIRSVRRLLPVPAKLALCLPFSEMQPETSGGRFVPVAELVGDGTLDWVAVSGAGTANLHRLRLLRDAPLSAGLHVAGEGAEADDLGVLRRTVPDAIRNPTCDALWVTGFEVVASLRTAREAVEGAARATAARLAVEGAIADGRLTCDQGVEATEGNNQATVHGVGQCFVPSRSGLCPLIQLYVALRGCRRDLPPPLRVEIRNDIDGTPGDEVLGRGEIGAVELGHEPAYRWGTATLDPPVELRGGQRYWIYCPDATHPQGSYVWRMRGDGAGQRGYAWSCRYKYEPHTWLFRVYLNASPQGVPQ